MGIRSRLPEITVPEVDVATYLLDDIDLYADCVALVDAKTDTRFTFADVKDKVRRIGSSLTRLGFKKGGIVCMYSSNSPEYALIVLGVLSVGGVITTSNPTYTKDELSKQLQIVRPQYLMAAPETAEKALQAASENGIKNVYVFGHAPGCTSVDILLRDDGHDFPSDVKISPHEVAIIPFSSGTTGLPKGVMLTHRNIVGNLVQMK
ncbi:4-coumarate--CoA ligase-like [Lingula anatina]|uniref:4-coumarate--CoA ligase-like n=1 Tax=Lingula anatina TaxID=7574 RepID=A0A1S3ID49_LINAN|nr:4-coumarate--CoA ligase-like [Lingula anatina]|eukprot:XP_013395364.1 4-coumarate--CoA ligase-like [Lingula anatina]